MDTNYNKHTICISTNNNNTCMYILMFTLYVTEYFLIWLQPLELTYILVYLLQKNDLMYMHYFLYLKGPVNVE